MIRLLAMLIGVVDTMEPGSDAWRRPVALVEDAIRTERPDRALPPQAPLTGTAFDAVSASTQKRRFLQVPRQPGARR